MPELSSAFNIRPGDRVTLTKGQFKGQCATVWEIYEKGSFLGTRRGARVEFTITTRDPSSHKPKEMKVSKAYIKKGCGGA